MIAITGGSGFIGTELVTLLNADGESVLILDTLRSTRFPALSAVADVCDVDQLTAALQGCDQLYHLAAEHRDDVDPPERYYTVNVQGTRNVVEAAERCGIDTIIFTSTVALYGLGQGEATETARPSPFNDYGKSKLLAEENLRAWVERDAVHRRLVIVRLAATFGPGNRGNLSRMIEAINRGRFVIVGSGQNRKSIAYVKNVASFLHACRGLPGGVTVANYADKPDLTTAELVGTVRQALGRVGSGPKVPLALGIVGGAVLALAKRRDWREASMLVQRIRKFSSDTVVQTGTLERLGFTPPFTLRQGLSDTIAAEYTARG